MIQIQPFPFERLATVLTSVVVPFKYVVAGKLNFLFREAIVYQQENDLWNADPEGDRADILLGACGLLI